jgi:small subunit ribosomal protein S8
VSQYTDPIADYLTRIRNALHARHKKVDIPSSKLKRQITRVLVDEGYLKDYINIEDGKQGILRVFLKYDRSGESVVRGLRRISTPGLRQYVGYREIPRVRNGLGIALLTTPSGVMSGQRAAAEKVGGEVLAYVW